MLICLCRRFEPPTQKPAARLHRRRLSTNLYCLRTCDPSEPEKRGSIEFAEVSFAYLRKGCGMAAPALRPVCTLAQTECTRTAPPVRSTARPRGRHRLLAPGNKNETKLIFRKKINSVIVISRQYCIERLIYNLYRFLPGFVKCFMFIFALTFWKLKYLSWLITISYLSLFIFNSL